MSEARLKTAAFTVRATVAQSARWKQASEAEGHPSAGSWLASAADAYLKARAAAGLPVPLAWSRRRFLVKIGGQTYRVAGHVSPPFACFKGTVEKPDTYRGSRSFVLVLLPDSRLIATVHSFAEAKAIAAELARSWVRHGGEVPPLTLQR